MPDLNYPQILPQARTALRSAYPELAAALAAAVPAICVRHVRALQRELPSAQTLSDTGALDDLPQLLGAISDALGDPAQLEKIALLGPAHAAAREGQGFSLQEIFGESTLLRRALLEEVPGSLGRALTTPEIDAMLSSVDAIVSITVVHVVTQRKARLGLETDAAGDFLSSLSHELRNEINSVLTTMELIEDTRARLGKEVGDERLDHLFQEVKASRLQMESTVAAMTQLLEAERTRSHRQRRSVAIELRPFLEGLSRAAERFERNRMANQSSRIVTTCPAGLVVHTDPDLLSTILGNLLGNAVKYAPAGTISLSAHVDDQRCRIEVADEGPGLTPNQIGSLFTKFERAGRTDRLGTGLGLYVAHRAAHLLGADLSAAADQAHGARFILDLPNGAGGIP
jgi:signal transduction histidine kinase